MKKGTFWIIFFVFMLISNVGATLTVEPVSPQGGQTINAGSVDFLFNINSDNQIKNCSLILSRTDIVATSTSITPNTQNTINYNFPPADRNYLYSIRCFDSNDQMAETQTNLITISSTTSPGSDPIDNQEIVNLNADETDAGFEEDIGVAGETLDPEAINPEGKVSKKEIIFYIIISLITLIIIIVTILIILLTRRKTV